MVYRHICMHLGDMESGSDMKSFEQYIYYIENYFITFKVFNALGGQKLFLSPRSGWHPFEYPNHLRGCFNETYFQSFEMPLQFARHVLGSFKNGMQTYVIYTDLSKTIDKVSQKVRF